MGSLKYDKPDPSPAKLFDGTRVGTVPFVYQIPDPPEIPFLDSHIPVAMFLIDEPEGRVKKNIAHVMPPMPYQQMLELAESVKIPRDLAAAGYRVRILFERFPSTS